MKKKIAVIGANDSILPLIRKVKEKGYEAHVFAWKSGAQGELEADFFYPISIDEKDRILSECEKIGISAVVSITSDFAVPTVNYIARKMGLVGNSEKTDMLARNKYKMRCAFKKAGIFTPRFYEADNSFSLKDFTDEIRFPLIVKPTDRWSSKGVTRVDSKDEILDAVRNAASISLEKKAIIEEFMEGPEYSAECICYNGEYKILAFTQKLTTGYPHYIETGHIQPSDIPEEKKKYIEEVIYKALAALHIKNSAAHVEFRLLDNGEVGIIEIGARMGGDCIGTDLTPISTGIDYIGMVVDVALGNLPDFTVINKPKPVEIKFIINEEDYRDYEIFKKKSSNIIIRDGDINDNFENEVIDSSTRHGYYIFIKNE